MKDLNSLNSIDGLSRKGYWLEQNRYHDEDFVDVGNSYRWVLIKGVESYFMPFSLNERKLNKTRINLQKKS